MVKLAMVLGILFPFFCYSMTDQCLQEYLALHKAAEKGFLPMVKMLVDAGSEINARSTDGTPLHVASWMGHANVVRWLLQNGARADLLDAQAKTACQVAANDEIREILRTHESVEVLQKVGLARHLCRRIFKFLKR